MKTKLFTLCIVVFTFSNQLFSQKITFQYDDSGNQIERKYFLSKAEEKEKSEIESTFAGKFEESLKIYPNPTRGLLSIEWEKEFSQNISQVEILSSAALIQKSTIKTSINQLNIDLGTKQSGIYFVRFHFTDGSIVSKKLIKL